MCANELKHVSTGIAINQAQYESTLSHIFNSQATGDVMYASSATQLSRLGIGSTNQLLTVIGGVPTWQSTLAGLTLTTPVIATLYQDAGKTNLVTFQAVTGTVALSNDVSKVVWKATNAASVSDLNRTTTLDWTDLDLTSVTSANAKFAILMVQISIDSITAGVSNQVVVEIRKNGDTPSWAAFILTADGGVYVASSIIRNQGMCAVDAGQVLEYKITIGGTIQCDTYITVIGYIE